MNGLKGRAYFSRIALYYSSDNSLDLLRGIRVQTNSEKSYRSFDVSITRASGYDPLHGSIRGDAVLLDRAYTTFRSVKENETPYPGKGKCLIFS